MVEAIGSNLIHSAIMVANVRLEMTKGMPVRLGSPGLSDIAAKLASAAGNIATARMLGPTPSIS